MISRILYIFSAGLEQLRLNVHYLFVVVLLFVFPLLFVWMAQGFFSTAYQNIATVEKQAIAVLHTSVIDLYSSEEASTDRISLLPQEMSNLQSIKILKETTDGLKIEYSTTPAEVGLIEGAEELYYTAAGTPGNSFIFEFQINNERTWQALRKFEIDDETFFLFTEHNFAQVDSVIQARQQQAYLGISLIFLFLLGVMFWLTHQEKWQRELHVAKRKLHDQMLFTNTIAHELRAPLTAVRGYISFLEESALDTKERDFVSKIKISTDRLLDLINDFLEVARIQSGRLAVHCEPTDITTIIKEMGEHFAPVASEKGLALQVEVPPTSTILNSDPTRLRQVVTNVISNAIKYTDRGSVTIALEQTKHMTTIRVKDTGHGISAEDQSRLFTPFMRVGSAADSTTTGTGLGMWITKQLIELLHGEIHVESIEGVGTHVKITFHA